MAKNEAALPDLTYASYQEQLKAHNSNIFKLIKNVSDFTQQLSQVYERHSEEVQDLIANFNQKNADLRKDRSTCPSTLLHIWETVLQEVQIDAQVIQEISSIFARQISRPLLEKSYYRKIQSKNVFTHRDGYEIIIAKSEEKLEKVQQAYETAYLSYLSTPTTDTLSNYFNSHNAYVQQLHATNGMIEEYNKEILPGFFQELEDIYSDICITVSDVFSQAAEVVINRAMEQSKRYNSIIVQNKSTSGSSDLSILIKSLPVATGRSVQPKKQFIAPRVSANTINGEASGNKNQSIPPSLDDQLVTDRLSAIQLKPSHDLLKKEAYDLQTRIRQIQEALETLIRIQQRSIDAALYNKANELQEDISLKKFDLKVAQIHLGAINAQMELFITKLEGDSGNVREKKVAAASPGTMKHKWLKALKNLKATPNELRNGSAATKESLIKTETGEHCFQEYTYKKITPCDVCLQVLRGHTKQGLKCKLCKMNIHVSCQEKAAKCQSKAKLLRRQKSTSEIDTKIIDDPENQQRAEVDQIYEVLKQATKMSSKSRIEMEFAPTSIAERYKTQMSVSKAITTSRKSNSNLSVLNSGPYSSNSAPHSPRRQKLNLRMKSLSLDSPESSEHVQNRKHHDPGSSRSSSSRIQSPSSPVHNRRLLISRNVKMSSLEIPDHTDYNNPSTSISPSSSPTTDKKIHQMITNNLYVVLYNFKSRHQDELDLKAGYKITVIDSSDPDWWKGKCLGRIGFFPSKYVTKLSPGEKPLQVTHNLQVTDGDNGLMLLRDQIVIQIAKELDGMVMIRSGDNRQGVCPVKFLQEV